MEYHDELGQLAHSDDETEPPHIYIPASSMAHCVALSRKNLAQGRDGLHELHLGHVVECHHFLGTVPRMMTVVASVGGTLVVRAAGLLATQ